MMLIIKNESAYSDGHESERTERVEVEPFEDIDELWEQLHDFTGDGHGIDPDLSYCYVITIVESPEDPELVGKSNEWVGI